MRLYALYGVLVAGILIAAVAAVPGLSERLRRFLIAAVALLVITPGMLFVIFGGT